MTKWIVLMPVMLLGALLSGCSTTTCSLTQDMSNQTKGLPASIGKGKLIVDNSTSALKLSRFDDPIINAIQGEWAGLSSSGAKNKVDCKFKYELRNTHELLQGLSAVLYFGTLGTFPLVIPRDVMCSADIVIRDESGKVSKSLQSEKLHADQVTYMSVLPTSWLVYLASRAPIKRAGFLSLECGDASAEAVKVLFKSAVVNELNYAEGILQK